MAIKKASSKKSKQKKHVKKSTKTKCKPSKNKHCSKNKECCPKINPADWIFKKINWKGKPFYSKKITLLFHTPIGFEKKIKEAMKEIKKKGYEIVDDFMLLEREKNMFSGEILIAIKRPEMKKPDPQVQFLHGKFITEYYQGEYKKIGKRIGLFMNELKMKDYTPQDLLMWYANCPKCAEKQGGPITILLAKVEKRKK